jgi:hypothetical protein
MSDPAVGTTQAGTLVELADHRYHARNWSGALLLYQALRQSDPALARARGVPLAISHCLIELRDDADPGAMAIEILPDVPWEARVARAAWMRARAHQMCRAGDFARARRLLKFLGAFDGSLSIVYADGFIKGRTGCWEPHLDGSGPEPGFLQAKAWTDAEIAARKARSHGLKVLLVVPWVTPYATGERYARSAEAFGLTVRLLDRNTFLAPADPALVRRRLDQEIAAFGPDVILYNSFLETTVDTDPVRAGPAHAIVAAISDARRRLGARVVSSFSDAWFADPPSLLHGLGDSIDLVHHCHPLLVQNPVLDDPRVYCYFHPVLVPPPTVAAGTIARACWAGSVSSANIGRAVWWAEAEQSGLPLDFVETAFEGPGMLTVERYYALLRERQMIVSLTRRTSGVKIVTARTLEVLAAGGVLLEEDSFDTRYFLKPGAHYLPFETWTDLTELIPWLLDHPEHRQRLARDGQRWVERYFSGDWFWTGLLDRLYPDA